VTGYKIFAEPANSADWSLADWEQWVDEQGMLINVWPNQPNVCTVCWGTTGVRYDGEHFATCFNCGRQDDLDGLVPVSYSWEGGLEGMLARAKNDPGYRWLNLPLAAVLALFLERHLRCIERQFGQIDIATLLPSNHNSRAGWDHLRHMHGLVTGWPGTWDLDLLAKPDTAGARDNRGIVTSRFEVARPGDLSGKRVLLVDDTWTSGGTMLSAAKTVAEATGVRAIAVTLGRQVYTKTSENYLIDDINAMARPFDRSVCAIHR
jgi:predicted amidophosphoribosyltransferase